MSLNIKTDSGKLRVADKSKKAYIPIASSNSLGVVKVGDGLEVETDGTLNVVGGGGGGSNIEVYYTPWTKWQVATSVSSRMPIGNVSDGLIVPKGKYLAFFNFPNNTGNATEENHKITINGNVYATVRKIIGFTTSITQYFEFTDEETTVNVRVDNASYTYNDTQKVFGSIMLIRVGDVENV